jgi:hypothetical protein
MINVLPTSVVDHGFKPQSGQTKDYNKNVDVKFSVHHLFWNNLRVPDEDYSRKDDAH